MISRGTVNKLNDIASFISLLNKNKENHVGYCGENKDEIFNTLVSDFSDLPFEESIYVVYQNQQIVGFLGLDIDEGERTAELWGPFIQDNQDWQKIARSLWNDCIQSIGHKVDIFYGFYNEKNKNAQAFMKFLDAKKRGKHIILKAETGKYKYFENTSICEISEGFYEQFLDLHKVSFPNTYYSGEHILKNLIFQHKLFIFKEDNRLLGYVYVKGNSEFKEGNIEYIAVSSEHRRKGLGKFLINHALNFLFNHLFIDEIAICVDSGNQKAINLYKRAGFQEDSLLSLYVINR